MNLMYWHGKWHVIYQMGRSIGMNYQTATDYLNIFDDAKYIERTIKIWKWEITIRRTKK